MNTKKRGDIFILLVMAYSIIASFAFMMVFKAIYGDDIPLIPALIATQFIVIGFPSLIYFLTQKDSKIPLGKLSIKEIILIILIAMCISPLLNLINVLSQFFVTNSIDELMSEMINMPLLLMLALTALTPAILEEVLTRGIIINNYEKETVFKTIIISGLFFGFIHMNINQFLYAFILGVIACYIVLATESIFASMIIHFMINASSTVLFRFSILSQKLLAQSQGRTITNAEIMQQMLETQNLNSTHELMTSALILLGFSAVTVPTAYFLIRIIVRGRGKNLKGSLNMVSGEFSGMIAKSTKKPDLAYTSFNEYNSFNEKEFNEYSKYKMPEQKENANKSTKLFTLPIILATIIFLFFAIFNEVSTRLLQ